MRMYLGVIIALALFLFSQCTARGNRIKPSPGISYYFLSFDPYKTPVAPIGLTDYERLEKLSAFCICIFDKNERIVEFTKWLSYSTTKDSSMVGAISLSPGIHFFAVITTKPEQIGVSLSLDETKNKTSYYRIGVSQDGKNIKCELVSRERMIRHEYAYWDNGKLRGCHFENTDNSSSSGFVRGVEHYDCNGKSIDIKYK